MVPSFPIMEAAGLRRHWLPKREGTRLRGGPLEAGSLHNQLLFSKQDCVYLLLEFCLAASADRHLRLTFHRNEEHCRN